MIHTEVCKAFWSVLFHSTGPFVDAPQEGANVSLSSGVNGLPATARLELVSIDRR